MSRSPISQSGTQAPTRPALNVPSDLTYTMRQYLKDDTKPHYELCGQGRTPAQAIERMAAIIDPLVAQTRTEANK